MENGTYITPSVPYGYIMKNGKLEIDPPKAEIVKMIFDSYLCGIGAQGIVNELNKAKVPPVSRGEKWYIFNIQYILTNERYIGNMLLQKTYGTDTVPVKRTINKGERDKFLLTASHEPIISSEMFYKVQDLLKINRKQYYKSKGETSIYTSIIRCGKCGAACKHKKNREKYYWVCREHDLSAELCVSTPIPDDTLKYCFIRMCNKLIQHYREILLPLRKSLQELNIRRFSGNTKILDIHKNIADLKEQRHVLSRLRKKGFMDEKKYIEKVTELDGQLARQERELKKISKADIEDDTLEQLDILIDCIERHTTILTEFDEELFSVIVEKIVVRDNILEFNLISGLKFKERI